MRRSYSVDDRGNVAQFYEGDDIIATLYREAGKSADLLAWDGGKEITKWAKENGYALAIAEAEQNKEQGLLDED